MKHRENSTVVLRDRQTPERRADAYRDRNTDPRGPILALRLALTVSNGKSAAAIGARRHVPIMAYVGPNGGGKTLCAVRDTLPALRAGKPVLSNTPIFDPATGEPFPSLTLFRSMEQLYEASDCEVLLDEMSMVASSRESGKLDPRIAGRFQQLRKRGCVIRWTAPDFARADVIFREVTQSVTECRGFYSLRSTSRDEYGLDSIWAPKRLFRFDTYEAVEFKEWSVGKREKADREVHEWYYAPRDDARDSYQTLAGVDQPDGMIAEGLCETCGKHVRREYCKGHADLFEMQDAA